MTTIYNNISKITSQTLSSPQGVEQSSTKHSALHLFVQKAFNFSSRAASIAGRLTRYLGTQLGFQVEKSSGVFARIFHPQDYQANVAAQDVRESLKKKDGDNERKWVDGKLMGKLFAIDLNRMGGPSVSVQVNGQELNHFEAFSCRKLHDRMEMALALDPVKDVEVMKNIERFFHQGFAAAAYKAAMDKERVPVVQLAEGTIDYTIDAKGENLHFKWKGHFYIPDEVTRYLRLEREMVVPRKELQQNMDTMDAAKVCPGARCYVKITPCSETSAKGWALGGY